MEPIFLREQHRYKKNELLEIFSFSKEKTCEVLIKLKEYSILKTVKATEGQKVLTDLYEEDIVISDVSIDTKENFYVFTFVGVVIIQSAVLICYPKYIKSNNEPTLHMKQVLKVIEKYNSKEQTIRMYNDNDKNGTFNQLALILYLMNDFHENGSYSNSKDVIETNGSGEVLWDKTINETFTLISNNRPYYPELLTNKRVNDDYDYFKRLHECILSKCSKELTSSKLLDLFDILEVDISDEEIDDFGDIDYILERVQKELNVQFNTRKQLVLKAIYTYISLETSLNNIDCLSVFGTNSFNLVWEKVCSEILDNQLNNTLGNLKLPIPLLEEYDKTTKLIELIEKPTWNAKDENSEKFGWTAKDTLIPDLISIDDSNNAHQFIVFDAKYYNIQLEKYKPLTGQPGIESVTKQYLYQLAYQGFVSAHQFNKISNCFLMPTEKHEIIDNGYVEMKMLHNLGLENIKIRLLPTTVVYNYYLKNIKMDIQLLML